jgi:hypothetical protein
MDAHPVHHETEKVPLPPLIIKDVPPEHRPILSHHDLNEIPETGALRELNLLPPPLRSLS